MERREPSLFRDLQHEWYKTLEALGFEDIEDTSLPNSPLKELHSLKFKSKAAQFRQIERDNYNKRLENLINHQDWKEICRIIVKHGNCILSADLAAQVMELHLEGLPQREIAAVMHCDKRCIFLIIKKARSWMDIL